MSFPPDARLLADLKRRCKEATGFEFATVRWDHEEDCLAVFEKNRMGHESRRCLLLDENNNPRQLRQSDVDEVVNAIYGRREMVDNWRKRWEEKKEKQKEERLAARREVSGETAREIIRIARHGLKPTVLVGKAGEPLKSPGRKTKHGFRVNDRRRVK